MTDYTTGSGQRTDNLTLNGTDKQTITQGGIAYHTNINGSAAQNVFQGGNASYTQINANGVQTIQGVSATQTRNADNTQINSGGTQNFQSGYIESSSINAGGTQINTGGHDFATQVNAGATQIVNIPQSALIPVPGASNQYYNVESTLIFSGGVQVLYSPYGTYDTMVVSGGTIDERVYDLSNGTATEDSNGLLTVTNGTNTLQLQLFPNGTVQQFALSSDGQGGTNITAGPIPLCFCRGTLVATPRGEVPVETIRVGDEVLTAEGSTRPVRWIGSGAAIANDDNCPVLVRRGAFPDGTPHRDLRVTRGHSFLFGDVLIPIGCLLNGTSILYDREARTVEVFHLELDRHGILIAEGARAESYRDIGNRGGFVALAGPGGTAPHGPAKSMPSCRPVVMDGPIVERTRRCLAERAETRASAEAAGAPAGRQDAA